MKPPKFDLIIEDCDKAIALNKDYVKAINRRANALEALDRLEEALRGWFTASGTSTVLTRAPRLHHRHDFGWIPKRKSRSGCRTCVEEAIFDESRRNHQGSHLQPRYSNHVNNFHRLVTHISPRIPLFPRTSQRSVPALCHRCQKSQQSRIMR